MSGARDLTAVAFLLAAIGCASRENAPPANNTFDPMNVPGAPVIPPLPPTTSLVEFAQTVPGTAAKFVMVPIPAGDVTLSDPTDPMKKKTVSVGAFWIAKTETTWEAYDAFVYRLDEKWPPPGVAADAITFPSRPYLPPDRGYGHDGYPAIAMSFHGAEEYCRWLTLKTGKRYHVPTEAEWWRAYSIGVETAIWSAHDVDTQLTEFGWIKANSDGKTHPVATTRPSLVGLFDMIGNASEWSVDLQGKPVTLGWSFRDAVTPKRFASEPRVYPSPAWNASDPQIPKSQWWLADGGFVGFRVACGGDQ